MHVVPHHRVERRRVPRRREGGALAVGENGDRLDHVLPVAVLRDAVRSTHWIPHVVVIERDRTDRIRQVQDRIAERLLHEKTPGSGASVAV